MKRKKAKEKRNKIIKSMEQKDERIRNIKQEDKNKNENQNKEKENKRKIKRTNETGKIRKTRDRALPIWIIIILLMIIKGTNTEETKGKLEHNNENKKLANMLADCMIDKKENNNTKTTKNELIMEILYINKQKYNYKLSTKTLAKMLNKCLLEKQPNIEPNTETKEQHKPNLERKEEDEPDPGRGGEV